MEKQSNGHTVSKKPEWKIDKEIKQELEDSATQIIEEFPTQDIDFTDDFSNDAVLCDDNQVKEETPNVPNNVSSSKVSKENASNISNTNMLTDVAEEFLDEDFEIFPTKNVKAELKPLTSNWTDQDNQVVATVQTDGQLPLQSNKEGEKVCHHFPFQENTLKNK